MSTAETDGPQRSMTLSVLSCGDLGIAILGGILAALIEAKNYPASSTAVDVPERAPAKFIACVKCSRLGKQVQDALAEYSGFPITVLPKDNLTGAKEADVIVLDCKPHRLNEVLVVPGMRDALQGKLLISVVAGVSAEQIEDTLYPDEPYSAGNRCRVVRAMPNTAATVRESMTIIETPVPALSADRAELVTWIFNQIGRVVYEPSSNMIASAALAGSGPAFMALALEGIVDGAVAMGIPRAQAQLMAAQVMRGTSTMVHSGQHPSLIKEEDTAPGGATIGGLLVLEDNAVKGHLARSIREATSLASQIRGVKNVNGTRI